MAIDQERARPPRVKVSEEHQHENLLAAVVLAVAAASAAAAPPTAPRGQHETAPANTAAAVSTSLAYQEWIGHSVESSDGQSLGQVSGLNEDDQNEF